MKTKVETKARGSALVTVMILCVVLCLLVGSITAYVITERRMNQRTQTLEEARLAAEALTEYGVSQIRQKFSARSTVTLGASGTDSLVLPATSFWTGGHVNTASLELKAGTVTDVTTTGALYYVDPADPANTRDPNLGKWVLRRDVPILAKATVSGDGVSAPVTSYAMQRLSVRAVPLFAHAVFYNMDMELFPGPNMQILGPVHVNGSVFVSGQGNPNNVDFRDSVTMTGNIYHAWKSDVRSSHGTGGENLNGTSPVRFMDASNNLVSMYTGGKWMDSMMGALPYSGSLSVTDRTQKDPDFGAYASARWGGKLLTSSHGVMPYDPPAIGTYEEDTAAGAADNSVNSGRQIIEPSSWPTNTADPDYDQKYEVEKTKYSNNAGVYVKVNPTTGTITAVARSKDSPAETKTYTLPPSNIFKWNPYKYNNTSGDVTGGMYDARRGDAYTDNSFNRDKNRGISLVEIDVGKLKDAVTEMAKSSSSRDSTKAIGGLEPSDWTGIVYVEVDGAPTTNVDGSTNAATNSKAMLTGVRLINGKTLPSYGTANEGLTVATNVPLYILGHYNADGSINTSSDPTQSSAVKAESSEKPAALVSDAISLLSPGWSDKNSYRNYASGMPSASANIEVSAAMLMGLTPTNQNDTGRSSGGLHNFPRFLENWSGKAVWIRGSLVALFECRVGVESWGTGYYSPPSRNWGFNSLFRDGRFPPGTPKVLSFKRTQYKDLTKTEYEALKTSFGW